VAGLEAVGHLVELDPYAVALAGDQLLRVLVRVPVAQVQQAVGDPGRAVVGEPVGQADGDHRERAVDAEVELHDGCAQDLDGLVEHHRVEVERAAVLLALVDGQVGRRRERAPLARVHPHRQRRRHRPEPRVRWRVVDVEQARVAEHHLTLLDVR
jgi:hypothetical protein